MDNTGTIQRIPVYDTRSGDNLQYKSGNQWVSVSSSKNNSDASGADTYRSEGIKITIPKGLFFCFYVESNAHKNYFLLPDIYDTGHYLYSYSEWNEDPYYDSNNNEVSGKKAVYAATLDINGHKVVGFEDTRDVSSGQLKDTRGDHDLNDFVFYIEPKDALITVDDDAETYIIAAEDMGSIGDFDFNDAVFSVKYTAGKTTATVKALAAGGTLPLYLYRGGSPVGDEIHSWFGASTGTMVNTRSFNDTGKEVEITVPTDFSLATNSVTGSKMGNFSIEVISSDGTKSTEVTAPGKGTAPQMICVPEDWLWPTETTNISTAYPDFGEWGANYTNTEWWGNPVSEKVVSR